jgi:hypothetical protein
MVQERKIPPLLKKIDRVTFRSNKEMIFDLNYD